MTETAFRGHLETDFDHIQCMWMTEMDKQVIYNEAANNHHFAVFIHVYYLHF